MSDWTVARLVARTQRLMLGLHGRPLNELQTTIDEDATEISVTYAVGEMVPQSYIGIGDELLYVWEVNPGAKTAVVSRGQFGTEATEHDGGAMIEAAARFPRAALKDALLEEVTTWPDTLFKPASKILELPANAGSVDAGVPDERLATAIAVDRSPTAVFTYADRWSPVAFRLDRKMPRDAYPSGCALTLFDRSNEAHEVRFLYGARFELTVDMLTDESDIIDDWGLEPTMVDIPAFGAAARAMLGREIQRADTSAMSESRVAAEVPPTAQTQLANALRLERDRRINNEAVRLQQRFRRAS